MATPEEADALLQNTIQQEAARIVQQQLYEQRLSEEGARTAKVVKDFEESHKEIAADPKARAVIEQTMFDLRAEDLKALSRPQPHPAGWPAPNTRGHRHRAPALPGNRVRRSQARGHSSARDHDARAVAAECDRVRIPRRIAERATGVGERHCCPQGALGLRCAATSPACNASKDAELGIDVETGRR